MRLSRGPRENRFRPAIDMLFRSAAYTQGPRVVGVVLTGQLDDGTSGLWAVKDRGGVAVVQSPKDAQFPSMPTSALQHVDADHVIDLEALPALLTQLSHQPVPGALQHVTSTMRTENDIASGVAPLRAGSLELGRRTSITCPECHGVLSEIKEDTFVRFRCHTGRAYSIQALLPEVENSLDSSLWRVLKTLHERALLLRGAADLARRRNNAAHAQVLESRANECEGKRRIIREMLQDPTVSEHDAEHGSRSA